MRRVLSLDAVNAMDAAAFAAAFGDIAEESPWVAQEAAKARPFAIREDMIAAFAAAVRSADEERQLALLRAHPDLAGKAAVSGEIGAESAAEQARAGLARLTPDEFARFTRLNEDYRARFGFPFILAVKGAAKHEIMRAFETRVSNGRARELATAIDQVCRIMRFRLEDRVAP